MADEDFVPVTVQLLYNDSVHSASPEKQAEAAALLRQYPQLAAPSSLPPTYRTYRSRNAQSIPELVFETRSLVPVLEKSGIQYRRQYLATIRIGRNLYQGRIDFYLYDRAGILSIIESKRAIPSTTELTEAVDQAKSYALPLGAPSFLIAAPEHVWLYTLERNRETLRHEYTMSAFVRKARQLQALLLSYR